jgi:TolA-binding protein
MSFVFSFSRGFAALFAVAALLASSPASAGLFDDDEARKAILDLRAKVEVIRKTQEDKGKAQDEEGAQMRRSIIELNNQIEQLRGEVAKLRGATEQQGNTLNGIANDVATLQKQQKSQAQTLEWWSMAGRRR